MRLPRQIRLRLTFWYVLLLAVILTAFSGGIYVALRQNLNSNLNDSLQNRADTILSLVSVDHDQPGLSGTQVPGDVEGENFVRVLEVDGTTLFDNSSPGLFVGADSQVLKAAAQGRSTRQTLDTSKGKMRVLTTPIRRDTAIVGTLQVGLSEGDMRDTLRMFLLIVAVAVPLTLAAASAGGVFLAGRALAPIDRLTRVARQITAEDLSRRLDLDLPDDEVGRLARTFDEMIARLDEAFRRQRQFTADASHELRTPLTAIKGQTEVALQQERDAEAYRQVLHAINGEVDRMVRLVGSLLTMARAEAGQIPMSREAVDLGRVVSDAVDQVRPLAAAKGVRIDVPAGSVLTLAADQDLLLQLLLNLMDNAVKYTPPGGSVSVECVERDGQAEVRVSDTGPGIPAEHLPHIFDRFYRADEARTRAGGGAGLGLSISRWIAEAHGGSITAASEPGKGSTFTVRLPLPG